MSNTSPPQKRDAILIAGLGATVSLAPAVWYPLAWPDPAAGGAVVFDVWIFAFSIVPFALAAYLRVDGVLGRPMGAVVAVVAAALVVMGQVAGLNPNDPSSTASIALFLVPIYVSVVVLVLVAAEYMVRGLVGFIRSRTRTERG